MEKKNKMIDNNRRMSVPVATWWKRTNTKKVNCDNCGKMVYFADLKNIGDRYRPLLVCKTCYYKLA